MNIPALLFPDLALIVIGWLLYRHVRLGADFWAGAEKMVYFVLFPPLLFGAIVRNPLSAGESLPMLAAAVGAFWVGVLGGYAARPALRPPPILFASGVQCAFRFNTYIALALALRIGGSEGLSLCALIVGFVVPMSNLAAVYALAQHSGAGVLAELARNPLVIATLGALLTKAAGLRMPEPVDATLLRLGQAALTLGLLCVGAGLRLERAPAGAPGADPVYRRSARALAIWVTTAKLVAMPLAALLIARALEVPPLQARIAVMFASMPTASAAYVLATRMGGDGSFVATLITLSLLASLAGIPFWLSLA